MNVIRSIFLALPPALWLFSVGRNVADGTKSWPIAVIDAAWILAYAAGSIVWIKNPNHMPFVGKVLLVIAALLQLATVFVV
jgi:hypothetical protein